MATNHGVASSTLARPSMTPKAKKRKADIDFVLQEMADGCTTYDSNIEDDIGECGFCHIISYKPHEEGCPVEIARKILKERS